ncbi:MAG: DUF4389 domain-containing protein [Actinomycetia bacterium]|nr:DUF4389 domain-containing protein [Actinomycetes bacterium]MCP4086964.1 DUF4389 domain-containing protein [Actinomycetes bacterium]
MTYPTTYDVETPEKMANWRPLVQWFLAIPHLIIVNVLENVAGVVAFISWFVILFTGKLPEGLANLQMMFLRYQARTGAYAGFLHDQYPPFEFSTTAAEPGGNPVAVTFEPTLENRNRLTVGLRIIWAIPIMLFMMVVGFVAFFAWIAAFFAVLFTGRWPAGLLDFVVKVNRLSIRVGAYLFLLTDEYPPFELPTD